jgi:hypothetical protein
VERKAGNQHQLGLPFPRYENLPKQSWNVDDKKALLFLESPESWNVYENTDSYAKKLEYL